MTGSEAKESRFPSRNACEYALYELCTRAGASYDSNAGTIEGIPVHYGSRIIDADGIYIHHSEYSEWMQLIEADVHTVPWASVGKVFPDESGDGLRIDQLPILFAAPDAAGVFVRYQQHERRLVFCFDLVSAVLFMLTRWEEMKSDVRDIHGRFPATASVAHRQGYLGIPVVDYYAFLLRFWIQRLLPAWKPRRNAFDVELSHDVDIVRQPHRRERVQDALRNRDFVKLFRLPFQFLFARCDPAYVACFELATISERAGLRGVFNFMAAPPSQYDVGYPISDPTVTQLIARLRLRGHRIGFHPGYQTFLNATALSQQHAALISAAGKPVDEGRQHFLRFQAPDTWRAWSSTALKRDSTLGYADHEGFRAGTCHPFQPFDIQHDCKLSIVEVPLLVMDGTLRSYRELSIESAEQRIHEIALLCKEVEGVFTLLWHNSSLIGPWRSWAAMYRRVVPWLADVAAHNKLRKPYG